jgi:alkyl hydroperoxide reductase 1
VYTTFLIYRVNSIRSIQIIGLTDVDAQWAKGLDLAVDRSAMGFGIRTARFAIILDDLKVTYFGLEEGGGVSVSGAEAVLAKL